MMKKTASIVIIVLVLTTFCYVHVKPAKAQEWTTPDAIHSKCGETAPDYAVRSYDDNTATYWWHTTTCLHWIIFDMGETVSVTQIRLYQYSTALYRWGQASGLYVYVSDDVENFGGSVWDGVLDATGWQESGEFSKSGRYVKLLSKSNSEKQLMMEFDAMVGASAPPANSVELKTPSNASTETAWSVDFVFNATFYQTIQNASLHIENTTTVSTGISWTTHHWNTSSVENKTDETITYSFSENGEGNYKWNVEVFNSTHGVYASSNRTLTIARISTVDTSDVDAGVYGIYSTWQRKTFYANTLHWAFYSNGTDICLKTSGDAITWSSVTVVRADGVRGHFFSVWFDGTYMHYAFAIENDQYVHYRRGMPYSNGTIVWSTSEQTVVSSANDKGYPFVSVDTDGHPWVAYFWDNAFDENCWISTSTETNGIWTTKSGFPYQLTTLDNIKFRALVVPLADGKMIAVWGAGGGNELKSKLWDGASWSSEAIATASGLEWGEQFSLVVHDDDNIHLAWQKFGVDRIVHQTFNITTNAWSSETTVSSTAGSPTLTLGKVSGDVYCFYGVSDHMYYKRYFNGTWSDATDWFSDSGMYEDTVNSFYESSSEEIGVFWTVLSTYEYNYKSLAVSEASCDDIGPVGPFGPHDHRVEVNVRLNGAWVKGCNVTVEGGPDNKFRWGLTNWWGTITFKLKTGSYELVATYEQYSKTKPIHVTTHMTIGIDFTKEDIIPDGLPEHVKDFFDDFKAWVTLPELDLTSETFLVFILPLIVLLVYAVKKASEGPKRKWKYSYLK